MLPFIFSWISLILIVPAIFVLSVFIYRNKRGRGQYFFMSIAGVVLAVSMAINVFPDLGFMLSSEVIDFFDFFGSLFFNLVTITYYLFLYKFWLLHFSVRFNFLRTLSIHLLVCFRMALILLENFWFTEWEYMLLVSAIPMIIAGVFLIVIWFRISHRLRQLKFIFLALVLNVASFIGITVQNDLDFSYWQFLYPLSFLIIIFMILLAAKVKRPPVKYSNIVKEL